MPNGWIVFNGRHFRRHTDLITFKINYAVHPLCPPPRKLVMSVRIASTGFLKRFQQRLSGTLLVISEN